MFCVLFVVTKTYRPNNEEHEEKNQQKRNDMAIIMISRGTFTGGQAVAEALAKRLNHPCISNEILFDAVEEFNVPEEKLNAALNEPPRAWRQKPGLKIAHMNFVRAVLLNRASEGNLVYHGKAGHLLLKGISHVLRVRVVADMEYRIDAAMTREGVDRSKAMDIIAKLDQKVMKWTQDLYGINWQDPSLYDAVLNLEAMSVDSAADVIAHMTALPDFQPTPASLEAFENLRLSSLVWAELTKNQFTKSANVRVSADGGIITVTGKAHSHKIIDLIPVIAEEVPGVKEVRNEVGVGSDWIW
jgi:cytidylate kinase